MFYREQKVLGTATSLVTVAVPRTSSTIIFKECGVRTSSGRLHPENDLE